MTRPRMSHDGELLNFRVAIYVTKAMQKHLNRLARQASVKEDKRVSVHELVRRAIEATYPAPHPVEVELLNAAMKAGFATADALKESKLTHPPMPNQHTRPHYPPLQPGGGEAQ